MIPVRYVRVGKIADLAGYSQKAIYRKIESGVWMSGLTTHLFSKRSIAGAEG